MQERFARAHPIHVPLISIYLTVVRNVAERLCKLPRGEGVG